MKKLAVFGVFALGLSLGTAYCQMDIETGTVSIGIAVTGQLPLSTLSNHAGPGVGGLGDIEVGAVPGIALMAKSGYLYHFQYRDETLTQVPVLGGLKICFPQSTAYVVGELGADFVNTDRTSGSFYTFASNVNNTFFSWDAGLGSAVGPADLRLTYNVLNASDMLHSMTLALSLGFSIWST